MHWRKQLLILILLVIVVGIGGIATLHFMNNNQNSRQVRKESTTATIAGQPINAVQLSKSNSAWQNGANTVSDGKDTNSRNRPTLQLTKNAKSIIIYFSRSGSTELLASQIAQRTGADILEIVVKDPYASNYQQTLTRANAERENQDYPALNMTTPDLSQYQTVYLGYPIWAMTLSHPMTAFLTAYGRQLGNKKIAPFMTQGGYGQGDSVQRIQAILRAQGAVNDTFTPALVVDGNKVDRDTAQVDRWVNQTK